MGRAAGDGRGADRPAQAALSATCERERPLEFGLRITVVVRETSDEAWQAARQKLGGWEGALDRRVEANQTGRGSVGQARLRELMDVGEVLDRCLWTAPARSRHGRGLDLAGRSAEEIIASLEAYVALGITKFILSDTPYREEAIRVGELVVKPMLARALAASGTR